MMYILAEVRVIKRLIVPDYTIFMFHKKDGSRGKGIVQFPGVGHIVPGHTNDLHNPLSYEVYWPNARNLIFVSTFFV